MGNDCFDNNKYIFQLLCDLKKSVLANDIVYNRGKYRHGSDISEEEFYSLLDYIDENKYKDKIINEYFGFYIKIHYNNHNDKYIIEKINFEKNNILAKLCKERYYELKNNIPNTQITLDDICSVGLSTLYQAIDMYDYSDSINLSSFESYIYKTVNGEIIKYIKDMSNLSEKDINKITKLNKQIENIEHITGKTTIRPLDIFLYQKLINYFDDEIYLNEFKNFVLKEKDKKECVSIINSSIAKSITEEKISAELNEISTILFLKNNNTNYDFDIYDDKNSLNSDSDDGDSLLENSNGNLTLNNSEGNEYDVEKKLDVSNKILEFINDKNSAIIKKSLSDDEQILLKAVLLYKNDKSLYRSILFSYECVFAKEEKNKNKSFLDEAKEELKLTDDIINELCGIKNKYSKAEKLLELKIKKLIYKLHKLVIQGGE